jgi:uncharacterized membrane protein YqjE
MSESERLISGLAGNSRKLVQDVLAAGENRLDLLVVELQEEREQTYQAVGLLLSFTAVMVLFGFAVTTAVVVGFWEVSRIWPVCGMALLWAAVAALVWRRLRRQLQTWQTLPETLNQLHRDIESLTRRLR